MDRDLREVFAAILEARKNDTVPPTLGRPRLPAHNLNAPLPRP